MRLSGRSASAAIRFYGSNDPPARPWHNIITTYYDLYYLLLLGVLLHMATNTYYVTTATTSLLQPDPRTDGFYWKLPFTIIPIGGKRREWRRRRRLAGVRRRLVVPAKIVTRGPHSPSIHRPSTIPQHPAIPHPPLRTATTATATNHTSTDIRHPTWTMDMEMSNPYPNTNIQHLPRLSIHRIIIYTMVFGGSCYW